MILPVNQNLDYDYPIYHSIATPEVLSSLFLHISMAGTAMILGTRSQHRLKNGNLAAGMAMRLASLGIVWFYVTLTVESSVIPIRDVIFEHRLYLPSGGFLMALVSGLGYLAVQKTCFRKALWILFALCSLMLTAGTVARNRVWGSELSLCLDAVSKSPNKARANYGAGFYYCKGSMLAKGFPYLIRAIELDPGKDSHWIALNSAISGLNTFEGRYVSAMKYHTMIDSVDPRFRKPWMAVSHNNLGLAYEYSGNLHLARKNYELATSVNPDFDLAWFNLAIVAARQQNRPVFNTALDRLQSLNPALAQRAGAIKFVPRIQRP